MQTYLKLTITFLLRLKLVLLRFKPQGMGTILLEGMEFFAYHGHYTVEQIIGTKFIVDIAFDYDSTQAEKSDRLHDAINYQEVFLLVKNEMANNSHLLEHVARRILDSLRQTFPMKSAAGRKDETGELRFVVLKYMLSLQT
jgi:7,8-dihydroneopterin aldolase/epimerase/oxygenase